MNKPPGPDGVRAADAALDLAMILGQTEEARAELRLVQDQLVMARIRLENAQAARIVEANEQLVLATLNAQKAAFVNKRALQEALKAAELDPLTELPNRALLRTRLNLAVADAGQRKGRVAVLLLGLKDFRQVNDAVGQAVGDAVLKHAATCLTESLPPECMVSHHGGDEFLVLLPHVTDAGAVAVAAQRMIAALGAPARFSHHVLRLNANVGISIYPDDGDQADSLIDRAVAAMYRAKWGDLDSFSYIGEAPSSTRSLELRTRESRRQAVSPHDVELGEYALQQAVLQEANSRLVVAALGAQELVAAAELAKRHQSDFMGLWANDLRNPLSELHSAVALLGKIPTGEPLIAKVESSIETQLASISRLIEDLLNSSHVSTGKPGVTQANRATSSARKSTLQPKPGLALEAKLNRLLAALPDAEWARWLPQLEVIELPLGFVLYESGRALSHAYFPTTAIVSLLYVTENGASAELAVVGNEGVVGISLLMGGDFTPSRAIVQSAGKCLRLKAGVIKVEFNHSAPVLHLMLHYTQALISQMAQTAVCNRHHGLDNQLCRFLLLRLDRLSGNDLMMTQEMIANLLGVRREGVAEGAMKLMKAGLIRYARGHITVLDRPGLEKRTCECYAVVKKEYDRLLPAELAPIALPSLQS